MSCPFEQAGCGLHWLIRGPHSDEAALYYKGYSVRFDDERFWSVEELSEPDTDWSIDDMQSEGWRYVRPWSDRVSDSEGASEAEGAESNRKPVP